MGQRQRWGGGGAEAAGIGDFGQAPERRRSLLFGSHAAGALSSRAQVAALSKRVVGLCWGAVVAAWAAACEQGHFEHAARAGPDLELHELVRALVHLRRRHDREVDGAAQVDEVLLRHVRDEPVAAKARDAVALGLLVVLVTFVVVVVVVVAEDLALDLVRGRGRG